MKGKSEREILEKGEEIYLKEFINKLDDVLSHEFISKERDRFVLKDLIDEYLERIKRFRKSEKELIKIQKMFIQELVSLINEIPPDTWDFYFDRVIKVERINCSACASLLGMILERYKKTIGLKDVEYGSPFGHSMNIVTFADNKFYWADARNNVFKELNGNAHIKRREGIRVYIITGFKGKSRYKLIPVSSVKEGTLSSYLGNLVVAYNSAYRDLPRALKRHDPDRQKKIKRDAKEICQEKGITKEKKDRLDEIRRICSKDLYLYQESPEFKEEEERILKIDILGC